MEARKGFAKGKEFAQCNRKTWKTKCQSFVHLKADCSTKDKLVVVGFEKKHNHIRNTEIFKTLPKIRRRNLQAHKTTISTLFKGRVKPSLLRSVGCGQVSSRDLANMRAKMKKESRGGKTPEEKLVDSLEKLLKVDPGASIHVGKTEEDELTYLFVQTSKMKENVERFGKVVLLDHTYKINRNRMPVTVMMVMDGHGSGRSAGYAFIANELSSTIAHVMNAFKTSIGPEAAANIKTFIIDKDYSEVRAISDVFPGTNIQLCDFHVSKTFTPKTRKEVPEVKDLVTEMRFCQDDAEFSALTEKLEKTASKIFFDYFKDNWLNCRMAWSYRDRKESINLGNNTTNRVEKHNGDIKMMLNVNYELYEALEGLLQIVQKKEDDVVFRNTMEAVKETYHMNNKDPTVNKMLNELTRFAAKLLIWEYTQKVTATELQLFHAEEQSCSCRHYWSYHLPCRHMMQCRRQAGHEVYVKSELDSMWLQDSLNASGLAFQFGSSPRVVQNVLPSKLVPQKSTIRYAAAEVKAKVIANAVGGSGDPQYGQRMRVLDQIIDFWDLGKEVVVFEASSFCDIVSSSSKDPPIIITIAEAGTEPAFNGGSFGNEVTEDATEDPVPVKEELLGSQLTGPVCIDLTCDDDSGDDIHNKNSDVTLPVEAAVESANSPSANVHDGNGNATPSNLNQDNGLSGNSNETPVCPRVNIPQYAAGGHFDETPMCFCGQSSIRLVASVVQYRGNLRCSAPSDVNR